MSIEKLAKQIFDECAKDGEPITMADALEMAEMEIKAKEVKNVAREVKPIAEKDKKPKTVKVSDEKVHLFQEIVGFLAKDYDICVITDNKLVEINLNGKKFKLNLSQTREKKK